MRLTLLIIGFLAGLATLGCMISGSMGDGGMTMTPPNPSCTPGGAPCDGCCKGTECKGGELGVECGKKGAACVECAPDTFCRSYEGLCTTDPVSRWRVVPFAASVKPDNAGAEWDAQGGKPDPYINLYCPVGAGNVTAHTLTANDTLEPRWSDTMGDCILTARVLQTQGFEMSALDDDGNPPVETITANSTVKVSQADLDRGWMQASGGGLAMVWFRLDRQP